TGLLRCEQFVLNGSLQQEIRGRLAIRHEFEQLFSARCTAGETLREFDLHAARRSADGFQQHPLRVVGLFANQRLVDLLSKNNGDRRVSDQGRERGQGFVRAKRDQGSGNDGARVQFSGRVDEDTRELRLQRG